jgi:aryl-alcohol dehydrogenase-like predicted oxidoreductase
VPIPGVKNARQAEDEVGVMNGSLTEAEGAALDAVASAKQPAELGIAV